MSNELKIVIVLKVDRGTIGVQGTDTDPVMVTFQGGLDIALQMVPELVEAAQQQWAERKQYPEAPRPEMPAPTTAPARTTTSRGTTRVPQSAAQQTMF